jgi:glucose-1-phosphate adenylyltransferase
MRKTVAIVFAGGRAEQMSVLTFRRPKAAVLFGGSYRMIDFALTNLANTEAIENVGILSQYRPSSLIDHVGIGLPWDFVGTKRGVRFLPPYIGPDHSDWYRGTADALFQNIDFLDLHRPDDVLIVSGDHAYSMDYTPLLRFHIERGADVTLAFTPVEVEPSRFGIAEIDAEGRVMSYAEKPRNPRTNLASMTVYVFRRDVLVEELRRHAASQDAHKTFQIYDEILPRMISRRRAYGWIHYGPWEYARTLDAYFQAHQDVLGSAPRLDLLGWNVRTNTMTRRSAPPTPTRHFPGAEVVDSLLSGGCRVEGRVERSVLSPDVRVGKGAIVRRSILWDGVQVQDGAVLDRVVCDKRCVIGEGARVGVGEIGEAPANDEQPGSLSCGATVLGMDVHVPAGAQVGRNCILYPTAGPDQLSAGPIPSGATVRMPVH